MVLRNAECLTHHIYITHHIYTSHISHITYIDNLRYCASPHLVCLQLCVSQGLEVEVQRLIARHRAELASALDKAADQAKMVAEQMKAQHDAHTTALKDRLRQVTA